VDADDGAEADRGMRDNHFLEFAGIDVVAAAEDHVLFAVNDRKKTFGIHHADVAGVKPAVTKGFGGRLGAVVITFHHVVAADHDLAAFAARHLIIVFIDAHYFDAGERLTDSANF